MDNNWAIHQLYTTANFGKNNIPLSWFVGGLNFQIEHHLFPNICHVHYPKLSKIVRDTAIEFNLPYYQNSLLGAISSHAKHLNRLGKYDIA
jgi:linoleoyl-CoA desaturase